MQLAGIEGCFSIRNSKKVKVDFGPPPSPLSKNEYKYIEYKCIIGKLINYSGLYMYDLISCNFDMGPWALRVYI